MPKNQESDLFKLIKGSNDPALEEEFIAKFGNSAVEVMTAFAVQSNRLGITAYDYALRDDGRWDIGMSLTTGLLSLLPCVPNEESLELAERYASAIQANRKEFGEDFLAWPEEGKERLDSGVFLMLSLWPSRVRKNKAEFSLAIALAGKTEKFVIRDVMERALPFEEEPLLRSCGNNEEAIKDFVWRYFAKWVVAVDAWQTARDRRIGLYATLARNFVSEACKGWGSYDVAMAREFFAVVFWIHDAETASSLLPSPIREKCGQIVGDILNPGSKAAFILKFDIGKRDGGMDISAFGPIPFEPARYAPFSDMLAKAMAEPAIYFKHLPENEFSEHAEMAEIENGDGLRALDASAWETAREILEVWGVEAPEDEDQ